MQHDRPPARVLVVDDAEDARELLRRILESAGYAVRTAPGVEEAVRLLDAPFDLVITDMRMPRHSGLDLVRHIRENMPAAGVMVLTGFATVAGAVDAVKTGADDYLSKPFTEDEVLEGARQVLEVARKRGKAMASPDEEGGGYAGMIGRSPEMGRVFDVIRRAAATAATVLITGESGTGKELVARAIHYRSCRASAPFVPINCAAIPRELIESELFGFVKGAFTGADATRAGFFQTADGGSLFLDEISETGLAVQAKLLRAIQEKEVCMVGSRKPLKVDVRIVAASNKDLPRLAAQGLFREDLFYRLNVIDIDLPPLSRRGDDVLHLVRHFTGKYAAESGRPVPRFSDSALQSLLAYSWPGNIRELENLVHRLVLMTDSGLVDVGDLPPSLRAAPLSPAGGDRRTLAEVERAHIAAVLEGAGGNRSLSARILGISRKTLRAKIGGGPESGLG